MRLGRAWRSDRELAPCAMGGVCDGRGGARRRSGSGVARMDGVGLRSRADLRSPGRCPARTLSLGRRPFVSVLLDVSMWLRDKGRPMC